MSIWDGPNDEFYLGLARLFSSHQKRICKRCEREFIGGERTMYCVDCHSIIERSHVKRVQKRSNCADCGIPIVTGSKRCQPCSGRDVARRNRIAAARLGTKRARGKAA